MKIENKANQAKSARLSKSGAFSFKAVMLDFDGTLTRLGFPMPAQKTLELLINLAEKMPLAFCSGRQFSSFERHGLKPLIEFSQKKRRNINWSNIHMIGENGSCGYFFKGKDHSSEAIADNFHEFYRSAWPENIYAREILKKRLAQEIEGFGIMMTEHSTILVVRPNLPHRASMRHIKPMAKKIEKICKKTLEELGGKVAEKIQIGNSGIGVVLCPSESDKDFGIKMFGEFLAKNQKMHFSDDLREILVIGDQGREYGNDYNFLKGKWGTPFTVGSKPANADLPHQIFNAGKILKGPAGTRWLLQNLLKLTNCYHCQKTDDCAGDPEPFQRPGQSDDQVMPNR